MTRVAVAVALLVMAVGMAAFQRSQAGRIEEAVIANCENGNELRAVLVDYIVRQINTSERSLHKISYYRNHPRELVEAVRRAEEQRRETKQRFAPTTCP